MTDLSFLAGQTLPAADMRALAVFDSYIPDLTATTTDPELGSFGVAEGTFYATGLWVEVFVTIQFASGASAGSGTYRISTPPGFLVHSMYMDTSTPTLGLVRLRDDGAPDEDVWAWSAISGGDGTAVEIRSLDAPNAQVVSSSNPWTWAAGDRIRGSFRYIAEPQ